MRSERDSKATQTLFVLTDALIVERSDLANAVPRPLPQGWSFVLADDEGLALVETALKRLDDDVCTIDGKRHSVSGPSFEVELRTLVVVTTTEHAVRLRLERRTANGFVVETASCARLTAASLVDVIRRKRLDGLISDRDIVKVSPDDSRTTGKEATNRLSLTLRSVTDSAASGLNVEEPHEDFLNVKLDEQMLLERKARVVAKRSKQEKEEKESKSPKRCIKCSIELKVGESLSQHIKKKECRPHRCEQCGKAYANKSMLGVHLLWNHSSEKPFLCSHCDKAFKTKPSLKNHVASRHSEERPHICDQCPSTFKLRTQLQVHVRHQHLGLKTMKKCQFCGKEFSSKFKLFEHAAQNHTGERNEECPVCRKLFVSKPRLREHMQVHGDSQYRCHLCDKTFRWKHTLKEHLRAHAGIRPYLCPFCVAAFCDNRALKLHALKVHRVKIAGGISKTLAT